MENLPTGSASAARCEPLANGKHDACFRLVQLLMADIPKSVIGIAIPRYPNHPKRANHQASKKGPDGAGAVLELCKTSVKNNPIAATHYPTAC